MRRMLLLLLIALTFVASAGKGAATCQPGITGGWIRMAPGMAMGAGFAVIRNGCATTAELVRVASSDFGDVSLHETRIEHGISRMRGVGRVPVRAGGTVELRPGGLHVMLTEPRRTFAPGSRARVEFVFADGRRVAADLPVRATAP